MYLDGKLQDSYVKPETIMGELYDLKNDPHEWNNVISDQQYADIIQQHRDQVPSERHEILGSKSTGHLSFAATEAKRQETD